MADSFVVYYVEANIVCVVVFGILLMYNHFSIDRKEKQIKFDRALIAFILYFLADSVWAEIVGGVIPKTRFSVVFDVFLLYLFMAAITYCWLDYVMALEQVPHRGRPINRFAVIFPFLVATAALLREIFEEIEQACRASRTPYTLSVSAGYDVVDEQDSFQSCILRADKKLYLDKESRRRRSV